MGMSICALAGTRLAKRILGHGHKCSVPDPFELTLPRLAKSLRSDLFIRQLEAAFPYYSAKASSLKEPQVSQNPRGKL